MAETFKFLPPVQTLTYSALWLNNATPAQVSGNLPGGTPFRWTSGTGPGSGLETFSSLNNAVVRDINDNGWLCGDAVKSGKRYPMLLTTQTAELLTGVANRWGLAINNSRDVLLFDYANYGSPILYHDGLKQYFNLDNLVVGASDDDELAWYASTHFPWSLNNRDGTNFGQISGRMQLPNGKVQPYLLIPQPLSGVP